MPVPSPARLPDRPALLQGVRRLVVKVGSGVLSRGSFALDTGTIQALAAELSACRAAGRQVALVSSGAIVAGVGRLDLKERPRSIPLKQAAAAIGQGALIWTYEEAFAAHGVKVAQVLLTGEDLRDRARYLNARNTLFTLFDLGVLPIINENDTVAVDEIKFGDNDRLSALVAALVDADLLVILTDTDGLFTADPRRSPKARLIPVVTGGEAKGTFWAGAPATATGVGGMASKVEAARLAAASGIPTLIANGAAPGALTRLLAGETLGTLFLPDAERLAGRKRWLALASRPKGVIVVDEGAKRALTERGKSLLPSGVKGTSKAFRVGDVVSLVGPDQAEFARGLTNYSAEEVERIKGVKTSEIERTLGYRHSDEVIHRDNLVILNGGRR
ncbi:MAG TPA: glutamate 5-kinase [Candidatus Methylomirabilis sp.]|nr:glutamate 5-kinase [Candidatus Methylomirabilis sp.]